MKNTRQRKHTIGPRYRQYLATSCHTVQHKIKRTHTSKNTDAKTRASKTHEKHKAKETYKWAPISTIPGNILSHGTTKKQKGHTQVKIQTQRQGKAKTHEKTQGKRNIQFCPDIDNT